MRERIFTAVLGVLLILYALFFNTMVFNVLVGLLVFVCSYELVRMFANCHDANISYWSMLGSSAFYFVYFVYPETWSGVGLALVFSFTTLALVLFYPRISLRDYLYAIFVPIYGSWTAVHLMVILHGDRGLELILYFLIAIWLCDTGAYFAGAIFGQRKLAPELSPNKTIEGAIGGLALAVVAGLGFNAALPIFSQWTFAVVYSLIFALSGIIGDLFESFLKRHCCVKDSGCVLPGHGGFLDRFDSILFTLPLAAALYTIGQSLDLIL